MRRFVTGAAAIATCALIGLSLIHAQPVDYATIILKVRPDAKVTIGGAPTTQKGEVRTFYTPSLPPGYKYQYEFTVTWKDGDKEHTTSKWVDVAPGVVTKVDLSGGKSAEKKTDDKKKTEDKKVDDKKVDDKKKTEDKKVDDKKVDDKKIEDKKKDKAVKLFNGKDLAGWTIFLDPKKADADPKKIFTVQDGTIICEGSVNGYIRTEKDYDNYVLTVKWRCGKRLPEKGVPNSGVFVHVQEPDKIWPKGVEAQLMSGHAGDFWLVGDFKLNVDPARQDPKVARHYFRKETTKAVENPVGEWNTYVITCKGDTIKLAINGQVVNEGTNAELSKGKILLQSEGAEIHFKDVTLRPLASAGKDEAKKEGKVDFRIEIKEEPKKEGKGDFKIEIKEEPKKEVKSEPKKEVKTETKAEPKKTPEVPPRTGKSETIKLFNGKDLDGWEGYKDLWSVKDGVIVAHNTKPLKVSTYLFTTQKFSDFRLIFSAKLVESEMHSGVAIWGKRFVPPEAAKDPVADKGEFTYQGQLVMFPSGWGLYDLYRRHGAINPSDAIRKVAMMAGKQHDWNDMEILAQGNRIRLAVNGKEVLDWRDPQPDLVNEGPIALQLHSNSVPQEIHFKGLVVETFPKEDRLTTVK